MPGILFFSDSLLSFPFHFIISDLHLNFPNVKKISLTLHRSFFTINDANKFYAID